MRVGGQLHAPAALPPGKETQYPLYRRLGGPQGVWTAAENLAPTGIRSPDRPACSESLYQLRYPGQSKISKKLHTKKLITHTHIQHSTFAQTVPVTSDSSFKWVLKYLLYPA
jgi:hypothetical protein